MSSAASAGTATEGALATVPASRFLERALLWSFAAHGLAMLSMAALLLPGMPGGPNGAAARMAYVAGHAWLWRLGWVPWQLTALSDLAISLALVCTRWIPRAPAALALAVTLCAMVPDQVGQALWTTHGVALARAGDTAAYGTFEARTFVWIAAGGGLGYTLAAIGWSWCLARARTWTRGLTWYSVALWGLFAILNAAPLLPAEARPNPALVAAGNAVGFVLLLGWLALAGEQVLRRSRPDEVHGRYAPWRSPHRGTGRALDVLANSRFARALGELAPMVALRSDIRDVIYVNYVVEAERLERLVPAGLELQRVGPEGRHALFSILTYRHGHLGPRLLGPLRPLLPSPVQTNWRIYVRDPRSGCEGVYFLTTGISSTPHALAARLLTEGLPMHVPAASAVGPAGDGTFRLRLDPGEGTAPDADAVLRTRAERPERGPWSACFASYTAMLAYCVPQDRALSVQPWYGRVTRQEIRLGIPLEACEPLEGEVRSDAARAVAGDAAAFCFRVARVRFLFEGERHDRMTGRDEGGTKRARRVRRA
jgi:hypothetical protein